jgi:hypothetical protein
MSCTFSSEYGVYGARAWPLGSRSQRPHNEERGEPSVPAHRFHGPPDPPCPTRASDGLDQARVIVLDVTNWRAHWPACHFLGRIGASRALGWVPSVVRAKPATSRGIPGAARSSLDVFALTSEMPDILKGGRLDCIQKGHIHRVWLISSDLCLCPLIVLSPSIRQLIVNKLCNCVVLRNNPLKWWITLLKKLRSAANYDRLLRFLDICAKIRQNITD